MNDLKTQIEQSAAKLKNFHQHIGELEKKRHLSLPKKCYTHWGKKSELHEYLRKTAGLLGARDHARDIVKQLIDPGRIDREKKRAEQSADMANTFQYAEVVMDFHIARHLAVTAYLTITWAIYDRLTNVCVRLAAVDDVANNPNQNPKVMEILFKGKNNNCSNKLGFSMAYHLRQAYFSQLKISSIFRNWLVHDGYESNGIDIFCGETIDDGLQLHEKAIENIDGKDGFAIKKDQCCLKEADGFPWYDKNLLTILENCHGEADIMFTNFLQWSVDSFVSQVRVFAERDKNV